MEDNTRHSARNASRATLDLVEALEQAADALRRSLAAAGEVAEPAAAEPALLEPAAATTPADFAYAMRRVEAEYYDAA